VVVGVNRFADEQPAQSVPAPDYSTLATAQRRRLADVRARRDAESVTRVLGQLQAVARKNEAPLMPAILAAVRARATVGEMSDVLRTEWGEYQPR